MSFRLELSSERDPDQKQAKNAEAGPGERHPEVVSFSEARRIKHDRKECPLQVGMLRVPLMCHAVEELRRNRRQSSRKLQLVIIRRCLHQQKPLVDYKRDDFRANLVVVARVHFAHPRCERFLAFHLQEKVFGQVGIRDRHQLGTLHGEWPENEVVRVSPARRKEQSKEN